MKNFSWRDQTNSQDGAWKINPCSSIRKANNTQFEGKESLLWGGETPGGSAKCQRKAHNRLANKMNMTRINHKKGRIRMYTPRKECKDQEGHLQIFFLGVAEVCRRSSLLLGNAKVIKAGIGISQTRTQEKKLQKTTTLALTIFIKGLFFSWIKSYVTRGGGVGYI